MDYYDHSTIRSRHRTTTAEEINDVTNMIGAVSMGFLFVLRFLFGLLAKNYRMFGPRRRKKLHVPSRRYFLIIILCILL